MKKQHIILLLCIFALLAIAAPWVINETYKVGSGYVTLWGASEMLSYVGSVIGTIGTIFIGIIAIAQSERANKISDKLLKMEELRSTPFLHLDTAACQLNCFREHEVDLSLGFRNETDSVINIVSVTPLHMESFLSMQSTEIKFSEKWTEHFSVLPHQTRNFNFFDESKKDAQAIVDLSETAHTNGIIMFLCKFAIKIKNVNSSDVYLQKYEFYLRMHIGNDKQSAGKQYPVLFSDVENSLCKE